MTYSELYRQALDMPMDELQKKIQFYSSAVKIMNDVKRIRIRDGEKTAEMKRRAARKSPKKTEQSVQIERAQIDARNY